MKVNKKKLLQKRRVKSKDLSKKNPDIIYRYMWLIDIIYSSPNGITFEEIGALWIKNNISNNKELPLRTFHNHRKTIKELFGLDIYCDRKDSFRYKIDNKTKLGSVKNRLINLFMLNFYIIENPLLEERITIINNDPGQKWVKPLLNNISKNKSIIIEHSQKTEELKPYSIEQIDGVWYLNYYLNQDDNNLKRIELNKIYKITL